MGFAWMQFALENGLGFMEITQVLGNIGSAVAVYLVATMCSGPGNLAIMSAAMRSGRRAGLRVATGVITASLFWGLLAASGLSILIALHRGITTVIIVLGGLYLGFLAYRAFHSFWRALTGAADSRKDSARSDVGHYLQGLAIHLTNPKSALAWTAIIAIVLEPGSAPLLPFFVMAGCWLMGVMVFCVYALVFSSRGMIIWYQNRGHWIDLASWLLFTFFSIQLIGGLGSGYV